MRLAQVVAEQGARRLRTLAILTAITIVAWSAIQIALQPEVAASQEAPFVRLMALYLVVASAAVAALERFKVVTPEVLLDVGTFFEVVGAFVIGVMENSLAWPLDSPIRGVSAITAWIAICALAIPNKPWKGMTAAMLSAAMAPAAHLLCAHVANYPPLPWNRLLTYTLGPVFIAGWTIFISLRVYRMQEDLSRAKHLGSYHLEGLLGKGGMGEVWRASHRLLRRDAAVKLIRPNSMFGIGDVGHVRQRFEQEAHAIASLRSPHTVALYDFGMSDDGDLYYVMELLEGLDLQALVDRYGPQPAGRVISLIRQACDSLEEAHHSGMVHRDLKPTNLFVCRLGKQVDFVKVLDFGLVKATLKPEQTQLTMQGVMTGTPAFMAPEQGLGEPDIDARADIYGLGCVAYFLLTGQLVFEERSAMATALAHIQTLPVPPSQRSELPIPASLERVVMRCLKKAREDRPQSAFELAGLLDGCTDVPSWTRSDAVRWWEVHSPVSAAMIHNPGPAGETTP
jgi:eukaryotic-like serine/threonine-protein kinase